jgi:hypothetical protein
VDDGHQLASLLGMRVLKFILPRCAKTLAAFSIVSAARLAQLVEHKARLAQFVEHKALNLVVVGSSPTVGAKCWDLHTGAS